MRFWLRWRDYQGRSSRKEYWKWFLASLIVGLVVDLIALAVGYWFIGVFGLICVVPTVTLTIRRLHDTGHTGKWVIPQYVCEAVLLVSGIVLRVNTTPGAVPVRVLALVVVGFLLLLGLSVSSFILFIFLVQRSTPDSAWGAEPQ